MSWSAVPVLQSAPSYALRKAVGDFVFCGGKFFDGRIDGADPRLIRKYSPTEVLALLKEPCLISSGLEVCIDRTEMLQSDRFNTAWIELLIAWENSELPGGFSGSEPEPGFLESGVYKAKLEAFRVLVTPRIPLYENFRAALRRLGC